MVWKDFRYKNISLCIEIWIVIKIRFNDNLISGSDFGWLYLILKRIFFIWLISLKVFIK